MKVVEEQVMFFFPQKFWETWNGLFKEGETYAKWFEHLSCQGKDDISINN